MSTRAAIYVRISKDKIGAGLGVERQEADCRALATRLDWTVVQIFSDNDMSAYSGRPRKRYLAMLEAIEHGEIDAVLAWHTDRLHRSPVELEGYISVCEPRAVPTHCFQAGALDLTTSMGRMQARIAGAVARQEVEHMSERIRAQKDSALVQGQWIGGARAFGYEPDGVTVREAEAAFVRDATTRVISGESLYAITKEWSAQVAAPRGGHGWKPVNVRRVLLNPRNAGLVAHRGVVLEGVTAQWPALVSVDEFRACADVLNNPDRVTYTGSRSLKWLGTNLYRCGVCGGLMRSAGVSSPAANGERRAAYRCREGLHLSCRAEPLDDAVTDAVGILLVKYGADLIDRPAVDGGAAALHKQANALRARLTEVEDMLGDGEIDRAGFIRQRDRIVAKLAAITEQLDAGTSGSVLAGVADATDPVAAFDRQPIERQRAIVDALVAVTVKPGRRGRLPKGTVFDYSRLSVEPKNGRTIV